MRPTDSPCSPRRPRHGAKPFVDQVMGRIRLQARLRKLFCWAVSRLAGALLAASHCRICCRFVALDASLTTSIIQARMK